MENYWDMLMGDDEGAANYMESYGEGPGSALRHFIGALINDGESVLDVGAGPGWNWEHFEQYGPELSAYKGLDYSQRFVRVVNKRVGDVERFEFGLGDVRNIKEPDRSWDVVLLQDVLEHTNGYEKPLKEALRVARKRVIVTFWHLTEDDDHINDDGDDGWGAWYSRPKWEKFLDRLNLMWLHDELPRKGNDTKWDIYVIDKEVQHG